MKNLCQFFLLVLSFCFFLKSSVQATPQYEGEWLCQMLIDGKPFGKKVPLHIDKLSDTEYQSQVAQNPKTTYVFNEDLLLQKENPKFGLMLKEEKLFDVEMKKGEKTKTTNMVCSRAP